MEKTWDRLSHLPGMAMNEYSPDKERQGLGCFKEQREQEQGD